MYTNPASSHTGTNDYQPYYYSSNSNHYETSMKTQPVGDTGRSSRAAKNPWQQQQPHDLSMDHSYPPPPSMVWHNGSPSSHHHASLPHPIDPPSKSTNNNKMPATFDPSYYVKHQPPSSYPPTTSTFRWHQDDTPDLTETKMFRRTREYNDLMAWMDNEFWEQNDEQVLLLC
ncbi:hypothetical protein BC941DRAFT_110701 [Chlamydoabsidia padenii]|nr:hypothetical protein BC941DRAFT_110701 [Chlamydoabsidia padenii]